MWLAALRQQGVDFSSTVVLGRQTWIADAPSLHSGLGELGIESPGEAALRSLDGWSDHYLRWLGADRLSALDTSAYEGADLLADLNQPLSSELPRVSVVLDGGTLEHVANVFTECGHGFYQFSPSLYWGLYSNDNGFRVDSMLIDHKGLTQRWYKVRRPRHRSERVGWNKAGVSYLHVAASRFREPGGVTVPQQDDYEAEWEHARSTTAHAAPTASASARPESNRSMVGRLPRRLQRPALRLARVWRPLPDAFEPTDLRSLRF